MSVKCKYSAKFWPLVYQAKLKASNNEEFKNFLDEFFENSDVIYNEIMGGVHYDTSSNPLYTPKIIDTTTDVITINELDNSRGYYIGNFTGFSNMLRKFKTDIISRSVFNKNNNTFINSNSIEENGITVLNNNILEYKISLLNMINDYVGNEIVNINDILSYSDLEYTSLIKNTLVSFEQSVNGNVLNQDTTYNKALDAYVILNKFSSLLKEHAPFIELLPEYQNKTILGKSMYVYRGPNVQHFTGFSSNKEVSIDNQTSDLVRILLDYFPELNKDGSPVDGTSIGLAGFNSAMTAIKTSIMYSNIEDLKSLRNELNKGAQINMSEIIDRYIFALDKNNLNKSHITHLKGKLQAIKKYIYDSEIHEDVRNMFTAMFFKTVPMVYMNYVYNLHRGGIYGRNLKEQFTNSQTYRLGDVIKASVYKFQQDKNLFKELKDAYNITISNGQIKFNQTTANDVNKSFVISYKWKKDRYIFDINGDISDTDSLNALIYDVLNYIVPEDFEEVGLQLHPASEGNWKPINAFAPLIAITLLASEGDVKFEKDNQNLVQINEYLDVIQDTSEITSIIFGSETVNVVKNSEGNNLPLFQLTSLSHNYLSLMSDFENSSEKYADRTGRIRSNIYNDNMLFNNSTFVLPPVVRSDISINDKIKKPSQLNVAEVLRESIVYDFYKNLPNGVVYLQNTTFADKNTHFLIPYDIGSSISFNGNKYNFQSIIQNALTSQSYNELENIFYDARNLKINRLVSNIIDDYSDVFEIEFNSLDEINNYIIKNKLSVSDLQNMFISKNIDFFENIHYYKPRTKGSEFPQMNETIQNWYKIFNDKNLTLKRLDYEKRKFIKNLYENGFKLNTYEDRSLNEIAKQFSASEWYDKQTGQINLVKVTKNGKNVGIKANLDAFLDSNNKVTLHPILETYFMTDVILSNEYNSLMIGEVYAHPNKNKSGELNSDKYYEFSEANRLIAQNKRAVILGATHHPFLQNVKNGVAEKIKIAVINDDIGTVFNMLGAEKTDLETMDGGGFSSPHQSIFENNSLLDARVGGNKKTIMHDMDPIYGRPTLLKWAVYETSNMLRQLAQKSDISHELLFKKMHNINIDKEIDIKSYYEKHSDDLFFYNYNRNMYFKIKGLYQTINEETGKFEVFREKVQVDPKSGKEINSTLSYDTLPANTIYDLDQIFGGAYSMKYNSNYKSLQYANNNIEIVNDIIVNEELKDKFISYLVNKSAIKVGAGNINSNSKFSSDEDFWTIEMSTKFGGVQMNADHDLDYAEVTEMTQMISALVQRGYTHDLVTSIYQDIGKVVAESINNFDKGVKENDRLKLYNLLGESLIRSFATGDKDTLGLAQSFVTLAEKSLQNSSLEYVLPFSAATINGAFIATVTSTLVKKGIRRKYDGVAAVLVPSNNMIQYYTIDGYNYTFNEINKIILDKIDNDITLIEDEEVITRSAIDKAFNDIIINGQLNPFIKLTLQNDIDFEDTIIVENKLTGEQEIHKIDSLSKYDLIKHIYNTEDYNFYNWTIKPKNLKASNTKFDILGDDGVIKTFSIYDLDSVRAANYIQKAKDNKIVNFSELDSYEAKIIQAGIGITINNDIKINYASWIKLADIKTQKLLDILSNSKDNIDIKLPTSESFKVNSTEVTPFNVNVEAAQIVMGKLNAIKFGLLPGDSISQVESKGYRFFYDRLQSKYQMPDVDNNLFDVTLFTGTGKQLLIKIASQEEFTNNFKDYTLSKNANFKIIDEEVFYNGVSLSNSHDKQFYTYTDEIGEQFDLIVLNDINRLTELRKSRLFDNYKFNYNENNWNKLMRYRFSKNINNEEPIYLKFKDRDQNVLSHFISDIDDMNNLNKLKAHEAIIFDEKLVKLSHHKYDSFKRQLNFIGARIPTQSMQSFMPMKVVAFTDSEINDIYVPKVQTWLQGSDYDIDKLYTLGYSIDDNGSFQTLSNLQFDYDIEEIMSLPAPNGIEYEIGDNGAYITLEELQEVTGMLENFDEIRSIRSSLKPFVKILNLDTNQVRFELPMAIGDVNMNKKRQREYSQATKNFMKSLNKHSKTKLNSHVQENALKNKVVDGIFKVINDPKNQLSLHIPINMDEQQIAAEKSKLGESEKHMTSDNPATKYIMQVQNMVGKEVIGSVATSLKVFFGVSNYFNTELNNILDLLKMNKFDESIMLLKRLLFTNPRNGSLSLIANVNLQPLLEYLNSRPDLKTVPITNNISNREKFGSFINEFGQLKIFELFNSLDNISNRFESALSQSGLLSAATDNAKELILAKINATSKFVDIYTYLMSIGESFEDIGDIMMSDIFNNVVKLTETNIFDKYTYGFNLKSAIEFYLNRATLPFVNEEVYDHVIQEFIKNNNIESNNLEILNDSDIVIKLRKHINNKIQVLKEVRKQEHTEEEMMYMDYMNAEDYNDQIDDIFIDEMSEYNSYQRIKRDFNNNSVTYSEYSLLLKLLDYVELRNEELKLIPDLKNQQENLEMILDKILPATDEMKILGRIFKINQGIKTNNYEKYSYIKGIENFINRKISERNKLNANQKMSNYFEPFDLMKFLSDPNEKLKQINQYEALKSTYNILDIITTVPHFSAMFDILYIDNFLINQFSVKNMLEEKIASEVLGNSTTQKLNQREFSELSKYVNDVLITNWLFNSDLDFEVPVGQSYYTGYKNNANVNEVEGLKINLNTVYGIATFKNTMDNYIIPMLKKNSDFSDNIFIKFLGHAVVGDNKTNKIKTYYRLPFNMMQIDASQKTQILYEKILKGFNDIAEKTYHGWKIADLFYLYNLVTNKDSFGQNSLTRIFEDLITSGNKSLLINDYYDYISSLDNNVDKSNIQYNILDLQYRLAGYPNSEYKFKSKLLHNKVEVTTTYGNSVYESLSETDPSAFTFNMPFLVNKNSNSVKDNVEKLKKRSNPYYKIKLNSNEAIRAIAENFFEKYNGVLNIINNGDVMDSENEGVRNANAFIDNGDVYINIDKANISSPLHEFTHIILAGLKFQEPKTYYHLLSLITTHPDFENIAGLPIYSNKHGSDIKEEVFVTLMSEYFRNKIGQWNENKQFINTEDLIQKIVNDLFKIETNKTDLHDLMATSLNDIFEIFGSKLFNFDYSSIINTDYVKLNQKLATLKDRAINDNIIKKDCE